MNFVEDYYVGMSFVVILSYLLGSLPTAYLVAKAHNINIFDVGSGNMGATNVIRNLGWKWGLFVFIADVLKGIVAISISQQIMAESYWAATTISAVAVIVGHNWSLLASIMSGTYKSGQIRGGKGASTALGTVITFAPVYVIIAMAIIMGVIVFRTRYMSLGVLLAWALGLSWLTVLVLQQILPVEIFHYNVIIAALLIFSFKANIQRLLAGNESKVGEKRAT